jgi:hypothetical protein
LSVDWSTTHGASKPALSMRASISAGVRSGPRVYQVLGDEQGRGSVAGRDSQPGQRPLVERDVRAESGLANALARHGEHRRRRFDCLEAPAGMVAREVEQLGARATADDEDARIGSEIREACLGHAQQPLAASDCGVRGMATVHWCTSD